LLISKAQPVKDNLVTATDVVYVAITFVPPLCPCWIDIVPTAAAVLPRSGHSSQAGQHIIFLGQQHAVVADVHLFLRDRSSITRATFKKQTNMASTKALPGSHLLAGEAAVMVSM
jgi:hypothetical protein